jgi:hypothetical protein
MLDKKIIFTQEPDSNKVVMIEQFKFSYDEFKNLTLVLHDYYLETGDKASIISNGAISIGSLKLMNSLSESILRTEQDLWSVRSDEVINVYEDSYQADHYGGHYKECLKIQYSYDDQKNWIKKICYAGTNPVRIITRDLSYF